MAYISEKLLPRKLSLPRKFKTLESLMEGGVRGVRIPQYRTW